MLNIVGIIFAVISLSLVTFHVWHKHSVHKLIKARNYVVKRQILYARIIDSDFPDSVCSFLGKKLPKKAAEIALHQLVFESMPPDKVDFYIDMENMKARMQSRHEPHG